MDRDYLQHIETSPYINEALPSRMKAGAAGFRQKMAGMMGSEDPYQGLEYTKLMSRYKSFIYDTKYILQEFAVGRSSPAERLKGMQNPPLTRQQREMVDSLVDLYQTLVPSVFPAGTSGRARGEFMKGGALNPPNISLSQATQHLKENYLTRKKAQASNNADTILNAYISDLKVVFDDFIADLGKMFPQTPKSEVSKVFTTTVPNPKAAKELGSVENFVKTAAPTPAAVPPVIPPEPPVEQPAPAAPTASAPKGSEQETANDFVALVVEVLKVINDRVHDDTERSKEYVAKGQGGGYYLPKTWDEPAPTEPEWENVPEYEKDAAKKAQMMKSGHYIQTSDGWKYVPPEPISEAKSEQETEPTKDPKSPKASAKPIEPLTGNFLYDFASLWDKRRSNWTIEVTEHGGKKIVLPSGKTKIIRVFWAWNKHENTIHVQSRDESSNSNEIQGPLLKFFDDQVNPRSPSYNVSTRVFIEQNSAEAVKLFDAGKAFHSAVSAEEVRSKPYLYAVVRRKGVMEFQSSTTGKIVINVDEFGNVTQDLKGGKEKRIIKKEDLQEFLYSLWPEPEEEAAWVTALEEKDYFTKFPDIIRPKLMGDYKSYKDSFQALKATYGWNDKDIKAALEKAWQELRFNQKKNPDEITFQDLYKLATKEKTDSLLKTPATPSEPPPTPAPAPVPAAPPVPSAPPPTPVPKATPAAAPSDISMDDDGNVTGIDPKTGKQKVWKATEAKPKEIVKKIAGNPDMLNKLKSALLKKKSGGTGPVVAEEVVNPFQRDNFLLY